jgi:hypothetical protein
MTSESVGSLKSLRYRVLASHHAMFRSLYVFAAGSCDEAKFSCFSDSGSWGTAKPKR